MPDDDSAFIDEPDDAFLQRYQEACARAGVEPVSNERARELVREWNALARGDARRSKPH